MGVPQDRSWSPVRVGCTALFVLVAGLATAAARTYGMDTHHATHDDIWWDETCRRLTPPTATDITLRRDLLDHEALYTIVEADLDAFIDRSFARDGNPLRATDVKGSVEAGRTIGPFGWSAGQDAVRYSYTPPNGASTHIYHDPTTGLTYQESAHW